MENNLGRLVTKALINGLITWLFVSILLSIFDKDMSFLQEITSLQSLVVAIAAFAGSFIGYIIREKRNK
ncbi:MAG: hypothetical protein IKX76_07175 [Eubacterium sp.]|nr:hypothetical protein [Eubacterium sp.]